MFIWIFNFQGYPTLKEESNGRVRGSKRHSARRRSSYVDNDEEEEGEEDDLDDRRGKTRGKSASMKGKMKRSSSSKYSTHRSQEVMSSPSKDNCLYTRVKTRRPQSSVTYSEYGSTVTNAKKTPAKRQSAYELRRRYQHESTESKINNCIYVKNYHLMHLYNNLQAPVQCLRAQVKMKKKRNK